MGTIDVAALYEQEQELRLCEHAAQLRGSTKLSVHEVLLRAKYIILQSFMNHTAFARPLLSR